MALTKITSSSIADGTVVAADIADASVLGNKIADNAIRSNNIVTGQITGNLIATGAISGNQIGIGAVSGNQIGTNAITGNLMAIGSISGNNIVGNAIRANNIVAGQITGNLIGLGAISANNFAGGGVQSESLATNLILSTAKIFETTPTVSGEASGTINIDVNNGTVYYYAANSSSAPTFNLRGNSSVSFDSATPTGNTTSVVFAIRFGGTRYVPTLQIDGVTQTPYYAANTKPTQFNMPNQSEINMFAYSIIKTGSATYTVFASNTIFWTG